MGDSQQSFDLHAVITRQIKGRSGDFLTDGSNLWQAAEHLKPRDETNGDEVPPSRGVDGTTTQDETRQVQGLISVLFPPSLTSIGDEGPPPRRREVTLPHLTGRRSRRR